MTHSAAPVPTVAAACCTDRRPALSGRLDQSEEEKRGILL